MLDHKDTLLKIMYSYRSEITITKDREEGLTIYSSTLHVGLDVYRLLHMIE